MREEPLRRQRRHSHLTQKITNRSFPVLKHLLLEVPLSGLTAAGPDRRANNAKVLGLIPVYRFLPLPVFYYHDYGVSSVPFHFIHPHMSILCLSRGWERSLTVRGVKPLIDGHDTVVLTIPSPVFDVPPSPFLQRLLTVLLGYPVQLEGENR